MALLKESFDVIPVWAKIYGVLLKGWSHKGFSTVASTLGKPLYMDHVTEGRFRLGFIKVCVEIKASSRLLNHIELVQGVDNLYGEPKVLSLPGRVSGATFSLSLLCGVWSFRGQMPK